MLLSVAHLYDSERSMGLHVAVCVRQSELWDFKGLQPPPPPIFPGEM